MLDTIKVGIPLTERQHKRVLEKVQDSDRWQWVLHNPKSGELLFRRVSGLAKVDSQSFHRELRWDVPSRYESDCRLTLEFSLPKFWYGHNIRLLYDFETALRHLKTLLDQNLGLKTKAVLPDPLTWKVLRADVCYAWLFPDQRVAQLFLDSLKRLHYPRKKPTIYPTAILFAGSTYSLKFYLKLPEFRSHDLKELVKAKASLEWVNHLEALAKGVLRVEATLRHRYLKRHGIETVADLVRPIHFFEWVSGHIPETPEDRLMALECVLSEKVDTYHAEILETDEMLVEWDEQSVIAEDEVIRIPRTEMTFITAEGEKPFIYQGGSVIFKRRYEILAVLQYILTKFVGANPGMQKVDEVREKLMQIYKPVKVARLVSFWLYVQKFGSSDAKELFGKDSYYYSKRQLKEAGVSLIEPPNEKVISIVDRDFLQNFRLEVPSPYVVNRFDDGRDTESLLNFVPQMSGRHS